MKLWLKTKEQIERFRNAMKLLNIINEEETLHFTKTGITALTMDPSHVSMVNWRIPDSAFESYELPETEAEGSELKLTVSIKELLSRLDIEEGEALTITHNAEKSLLQFSIVRPEINRTRELKLKLLETEGGEVPAPKILYKANGRILLKDFKRALKDAAIVAEHLTVVIDKGERHIKVMFDASGDLGDAGLIAEALEGQVEEKAKATFTISYLEEAIRTSEPLTELVSLHLSNDLPLRVTHEDSLIECTFYFAPCINP